MKMRFFRCSALAIPALIAGSFQAHAQSTQITSPAGLSGADTTVYFNGLPSGNLGTPVNVGAGGGVITFSNETGFEVVQAGSSYPDTAFANGTNILFGAGYDGSGGPVTIDFATANFQVGFNAEEFANGPYTMTFSAYDGATWLGTYTANGSDPDGGFNSNLSFEGVQATDGYDITSIVLSDDNGDNIGIGPISYLPVSYVTPEPGSFGLLLTGLAGLGEMIRRKALRCS